MILSTFENAVKTYDITWLIRKASEASTRELHGSGASSPTLGVTSFDVPASVESSTTPTPRATSTTEYDTAKKGNGLMESVKGVKKLGLGSKNE